MVTEVKMDSKKVEHLIHLCDRCGKRFEDARLAKKLAKNSVSNEELCGRQYRTVTEEIDGKAVSHTTDVTTVMEGDAQCRVAPTGVYRISLT